MADNTVQLTRRPAAVLIAAAVLSALYGWLVFATTFNHPGKFGFNYNTPGSDFMVFHGAIRAALHGDIGILFDGDRFTAMLNHSYGDRLNSPLPFRPWVYPPSFLVLLLPVAPFDFLTSYALFELAGALLLVAALCLGRTAPPGARWIAAGCLLCPAASICVVDGQGSFLVAGLLIAGARLLANRPALAGAVWGVLSFKPQFALVLPAAILARRAPRGALAAAFVALGLAALSAILFTPEAWRGWLTETAASNAGTDPRWLLYGRIWGHSIFTCATLLGAGPRLATAAQAVGLLVALAAVYRVFRAPCPPGLRVAVLLGACLLAAPHWGTYDGVLLTAAVGLWLAEAPEGRSAPAWMLGFIVWILPLLGPPAVNWFARLWPLLTLVVIGVALASAGKKVAAPGAHVEPAST